VCQNTLNMALQGVKQSFKIRHTQTVGGKVMAAREALLSQTPTWTSSTRRLRLLFRLRSPRLSSMPFLRLSTRVPTRMPRVPSRSGRPRSICWRRFTLPIPPT
jgi:hypothetical protein